MSEGHGLRPGQVATLSAPPEVAPVRELQVPTLERAIGLNKVLSSLFSPEHAHEHAALTIGRYEVRRSLGSGGMGQVYEAFDPQLERMIAIKVLHPGASVGQRLLLEGKAMARLSHPNVVTVHDVGIADDRTFVAMERVSGATLRSWQEDHVRSWREVVEMYLAMGAGIVAAHEERLVHCDLKPENVLVGADQRPRVTDFGIAQLGVEVDDTDTGASIGPDAQGRPIGTPHYMSPEQFTGGVLDARTDQFAFCVMLWEALFGERPFTGSSTYELAANVIHGDRRTPTLPSPAPPWIRRALERGLAVDPAQRWPSMADLLEDLRHARSRLRRRRLRWGALALAGVAAGVFVWRSTTEARAIAACDAQGARITEVWTPDRRDALRNALQGHDVIYAANTADTVVDLLDRRATAWSEAQVHACRRNTVEHSWSAGTLARADWCLDDRRLELEMVIEQLSTPRGPMISSAVRAVHSLTPIVVCLEGPRLDRMTVPPGAAQAQVRAVSRQIAHARVLLVTGQVDAASHEVDEALEQARAVGWGPLEAKARLLRARVAVTVGHTEAAADGYIAAYFGAKRNADLTTAIHAALALASLAHDGAAIGERPSTWVSHAGLAIEELGVTDGLETARYLTAEAGPLEDAGHLDEAEVKYRRALDIRRSILGPGHPLTLRSLATTASIQIAHGNYDEAIAIQEESLRRREKQLGPHHPSISVELTQHANAYIEAGKAALAQPLLERALEVHQGRKPDKDYVLILSDLGSVQTDLGNHREALRWHLQAQAMAEDVLPKGHLSMTQVLNNLANTHMALGEYDRAQRLLEGVVALLEANDVPKFPHLAVAQCNLAWTLAEQGLLDAAQDYFERSLAIRETQLGPDHQRVATPLLGLANLALQREQPQRAQQLARRALSVLVGHPQFVEEQQLARLYLAEAAWALESSPTEARATIDALAESPDSRPSIVEQAREWLAAHPLP